MSKKMDLTAEGQRLTVLGITPYKTRDGEERSSWTRVGRAFLNRDGSLQVLLDFVPAQGQALQVRVQEDRDRESGGGGGPPF